MSNRKILKFTVPIQDSCTIEMPYVCQFLSAQEQHGLLTMWFNCDVEMKYKKHRFYVRGTGHDMPPIGCKFLATVQIREFVWHLFSGGLDE